MEFDSHTLKDFNEDLEDLKTRVMAMGGLVEEQLANATKGLLKSDHELAVRAASSDYKINAKEVEIDELCATIIARRQPAASDLRMILSAIKIINDLERVGDEAEKIGRFASALIAEAEVRDFRKNLKHMAKLARRMLSDALDCYARIDDTKAMELLSVDSELDDEFDTLTRSLITYVMEDPRTIKNVLVINWCARSLERIGDHASNICEFVVYLVQGTDIRHINNNSPD